MTKETLAKEILAVKTNAERLWSAEQLSVVYARMAAEIHRDTKDADLLVLTVMSGGLFLTAELLKRMEQPLQMDYVLMSRYRGGTKGGELSCLYFPESAARGRDVLLVDDILDVGITMQAAQEACRAAGARSTRAAVLVDKEHDRRVDGVAVDYVGVPVDDRYVFGCGMDYKGYWRNLDGIYALSGPA